MVMESTADCKPTPKLIQRPTAELLGIRGPEEKTSLMRCARTRSAIRDFRRSEGLTVSDRVDSTLLSRLEQAAAG